MSELIALNNLKSKHRIRVGQKLRLPTRGSSSRKVAYDSSSKSRQKTKTAPRASAEAQLPAALPKDGYYTVARGDNLTRIAQRFGLSVSELVSLNQLRSQNRIAVGQKLLINSAKSLATQAKAERRHPDATAKLTPARSAEAQPSATDTAMVEPTEAAISASDESAIEPSPGLLADPSDYTVATNGAIVVQANETLGHYAEWLGLRASRLRQINRLRYGEPVVLHQKLQLDFSQTPPEEFERVRVEYHRVLQEEFFAAWEIAGTRVHRVSAGDSLWILSTRRFGVPIWLLRQYNPDVDLEALSMGTELTIPKLRQRGSDADQTQATSRGAAAG
jgi:membrane-bound lytic murein transglycosylase D